MVNLGRWSPQLLLSLRAGYKTRDFGADLIAGITVGLVALPLAMAFGIASGVPPQAGIYTAVIAGFLISSLGGSRVQIGGPTGAFVVIVAGIVARHGLDGLLVATLMAGVLLVALGLARLGSAVKFIPHAIVTGFTSGIALIIFSSQVKDLLGLHVASVPADFLGKWSVLALHLGTWDANSAGVAAATLLVLALWPRVNRTVPAPFVALVAVSAAVAWLKLPVETIGTRFGALPTTFPAPRIPGLPFAEWADLVGPACTIAL